MAQPGKMPFQLTKGEVRVKEMRMQRKKPMLITLRRLNYEHLRLQGGFPGGASGKAPTSQCRTHKGRRFIPSVGKIPWRRAWQSTPVFLPGEPKGQEPGGLLSIGSQRTAHN